MCQNELQNTGRRKCISLKYKFALSVVLSPNVDYSDSAFNIDHVRLID